MMNTYEEQILTAVKYIKRRDRKLGIHVDLIGKCTLAPSRYHFDVLARSIIGQQLSSKASSAIVERVERSLNSRRPFSARVINDAPEGQLLSAGVSRAKVSCIKLLAAEVLSTPSYFRHLKHCPDEHVINSLTSVKGIGRWTAEMFLIFGLGRLDILSVSDAGLKRGLQLLLGLENKISEEDWIAYAERWRPFRSVASWYLWAMVDGKSKAAFH